MGAFFYHRFIFLLACINRWKVYNRLSFACTVKTAIEVKCLSVSTSKKRHSCRDNLAFRTTMIEDAHLTLAVISFKVEAKNSLIFYHYNIRVSVPVTL